MALFTKESLESLKQKVDIVDVISGHMDLKRAGTSYKGLCPFHDEKSPSFNVNKSQGFYHCFGCGAHGDAITFMMQHARLSFTDAVEALAQRYNVYLERVEFNDSKEKINKPALKLALEKASELYHTLLLHSEEGHAACKYLFDRGIDLDFIQRFRIGYSPQQKDFVRKILINMGIPEKHLIDTGILVETQYGTLRDPFSDRITFPIRDSSGSVVGFSARRFKEGTFGGKYVNTSETPLFKKSRILFGLDQSRRTIAKERRVVIVEGQLDALRLLYHGLDITVASQGTAFGEGHLKELTNLGAQEVLLAFDNDKAGREAAFKVGNLCAKAGMDVKIIRLPEGSDPDSLVQEQGIEAFIELINKPQDFISFLVDHLSLQFDLGSPAGKNALAHHAIKQIHAWEEPIIVHESLRRLSQLLQLPQEFIQAPSTHVYMPKNSMAGMMEINPDKVLESDLLRWLIVTGPLKPHFVPLALNNISPDHFIDATCRHVFEAFVHHHSSSGSCDLLTLASSFEDPQAHQLIHEIVERRVNLDKADDLFHITVQRMLEKEWMRKREEVRLKIQSGTCSDDEVLKLLREFDALKGSPPVVKISDKMETPI
ncbi:MAG: DNA primase [Parachlamydiales bacterium]|jgi:DNA primase